MNTNCYCHSPEHEVCWGLEPNPDCPCCQATVSALEEYVRAGRVCEATLMMENGDLLCGEQGELMCATHECDASTCNC